MMALECIQPLQCLASWQPMLANPNILLLGEIVSQATTGLRNVTFIKAQAPQATTK